MEEIPAIQPEGAASSEERREQAAFNLGALTINQIVRLNIALSWETSHNGDGAGRAECDDLINKLEGDIAQTAVTDPARARGIMLALKDDENYRSQETAAYCAPKMLSLGYEFVRDVLLDLGKREGDLPDLGDAVTLAVIDTCAQLPPDQAADLRCSYERVSSV